MKKAILLSGGMDSISLAYWKRPEVAYTIDYGQSPAKTEVRVSKTIAKLLNIQHHVIRIDCSSLGSGDLVNKEALNSSPSKEWWPYRNQLLITLALMKAISHEVKELMIASVKSDGFHKDGTPEFYSKINRLSEYQEGEIKVSSPCIDLTTTELIKCSKIPYEVLLWSYSCHTSELACGKCRGCIKYANTIFELKLLQ